MSVPTFSINEPIPRETGTGQPWKPPVWTLGALGLIAHARAVNAVGHAAVFAAAGRWSQPPTQPWERPF